MRARAADFETYARWEQAIEFRLFGDASGPTLTVPEQIAAQVGDRIIAGTLAPGERIGEQELADEFQVSRGPVREAIRILEREGLVAVLPRRGAVVTRLSADELRELFEVRAGLFEIAIRKVAATRPPELLSVMRAGVARLEALADDPAGGDAYAETTHRLIQISARFAGNERLRRMIGALSLQSLRYSKLGLAAVERRKRSVRLWQQALKALERGDAEQMVLLARQRSEESADEATRQLGGVAAAV
jgi:DNA-binding GntR family transcriptional regulator